jgi:hypothetical protein
MRRVKIVEDPRSVMRLHDRGLLERSCESLEWKVQKVRQRSRNGLGERTVSMSRYALIPEGPSPAQSRRTRRTTV